MERRARALVTGATGGFGGAVTRTLGATHELVVGGRDHAALSPRGPPASTGSTRWCTRRGCGRRDGRGDRRGDVADAVRGERRRRRGADAVASTGPAGGEGTGCAGGVDSRARGGGLRGQQVRAAGVRGGDPCRGGRTRRAGDHGPPRAGRHGHAAAGARVEGTRRLFRRYFVEDVRFLPSPPARSTAPAPPDGAAAGARTRQRPGSTGPPPALWHPQRDSNPCRHLERVVS